MKWLSRTFSIFTFASVITLIGYNAFQYFLQNQVDSKEVTEPYGWVPTSGVNKYPAIIRLTKDDGFFCSAVVIDGQYALTAAHCVKDFLGRLDQTIINVYDVDGLDTKTQAKPIALNNDRDIALLKGNFADFEAAKIDYDGSTTGSLYGTAVINCGFPSGGLRYCSGGYITGNDYFKLTAQGQMLFRGMSGGPVYGGTQLRVIGVNSAVANDHVIIGPILGSFEIFGINPR